MGIRRRALLAALVSLLIGLTAAACAPTPAVQSVLTVDGLHVSLHYAPSATARPLVLALHGIGSDGSDFEKLTGLDAFADAHGFVVAYPDGHIAPDVGLPEPVTTPAPSPAPTMSPALTVAAGKHTSFVEGATTTPTPSSKRAWDAGTICCGRSTADDVTYLKNVVTAVAAKTKIDLHRVYVIGLSNGGMMALKAICDAPTVFAAAGSVAGPYLGTACGRPVWIHLHGANDPVVPYLGGAPRGSSFLHVPADWCGCSFPDSATESARFSAFTVGVVRVPYGMHTWPRLGDGSWNVDGNGVLWTFLSRFKL